MRLFNAAFAGRFPALRIVAGALALAGLTVYAGCNSVEDRVSLGGLGSGPENLGPTTLEERIAEADVIARARFVSATPVAASRTNPAHYIGVVELRFRVLEYLRGSGANEIVALIDDEGIHYDTSAKALEGAKAIRDRRDTQWDGREAILFLLDDMPGKPSTSQANRYWLGFISTYTDGDGYTIDSDHKQWLPDASAGGAGTSSGSDTQRFLLAPPPPSGGASGQSASTSTITLASLKAKIAANTAAIGGSEAMKECLYQKRKWAREAQYRFDRIGTGKYFYIRHDAAIGSGLAKGTRAFTDPYVSQRPATAPASAGDYPLTGRDAALFTTKYPGVADTVRPLPAGTYKFYYGGRPKELIICDGLPKLEQEREEVFVTVTAPTGTVHEAFFDPVTLTAGGVGANSTEGDLKPAAFTVGGQSVELESLAWSGGSAVLTLDTHVSLSGQALDAIALNGTGAVTLAVADATVDQANATWTWSVAAAPWKNGDKLMLRIRQNQSEEGQ